MLMFVDGACNCGDSMKRGVFTSSLLMVTQYFATHVVVSIMYFIYKSQRAPFYSKPIHSSSLSIVSESRTTSSRPSALPFAALPSS